MKRLFIVFALLTGGFCLKARAISFDSYFENENACFILFEIKSGKYVEKYNEAQCSLRIPACSTFKVPLALMAVDQGLIQDENTTFKWDGKKREMKDWNHDQTAGSWIKYSVVWVSQQLTKQLGKEKVEKYLKDFGFGTADMSGGIETAWLTATSLTDPTRPSVLISAEEQTQFLAKLWRDELPVSKNALAVVKKISFLEKSAKGYELSGKTGSGFVNGDRSLRVGWFAGHVGKGSQQYVTVVSFTDKNKFKRKEYGGLEAREKAKEILSELGLY